jgi:hypothetical protein
MTITARAYWKLKRWLSGFANLHLAEAAFPFGRPRQTAGASLLDGAFLRRPFGIFSDMDWHCDGPPSKGSSLGGLIRFYAILIGPRGSVSILCYPLGTSMFRLR